MISGLWVWPTIGAVLGAIIGSHVATIVLRWPRGESAISGRSRCDGCAAPLGALDLVPIASFLALRGRSRCCGATIDRRHLPIELGAAAIGLAACIAAPGPAGLAGALFGWLLLALAWLDAGHFWLPDRLTGALALAGLGAGLLGLPPPIADRLIGGVAGYAILAGLALLYRRTRGRDGLGGGDAKLLGAIGLWLGWRALPPVLLGASLAGLALAAGLRLSGRRVDGATRFPLGTLLAVAAWLLWWATAWRGGEPPI